MTAVLASGLQGGWLMHDRMDQLCVRLTRRMFGQLDALAAERGVTRTRVVRQLLEAGLRGRPAPTTEPPIRALLSREEEPDPRERLLREFARMAEDARERNS
jgi:hypothetical protein